MRNVYQVVVKTDQKNEAGENIWKYLDLGKDSIYWNIEVNNIAKLENRNASSSLAIKFPFSQNNCEIFGYANMFDAVTDAPYKKMDCRMYCAERTLAGKGSYLVLFRTSNAFECQILSGVANLFDMLQDSPMGDLEKVPENQFDADGNPITKPIYSLGKFQVNNYYLNPENWPDTYKIGYGVDFQYDTDTRPKENGITKYLPGVGSRYPAISIEKAVANILGWHGYSYSINQNVFQNKYVSLANVEVKREEEGEDGKETVIGANWEELVDSFCVQVSTTDEYVPVRPPIGETAYRYKMRIVHDPNGLSSIDETNPAPGVEYHLQMECTFNVLFKFNNTGSLLDWDKYYVEIYKNGEYTTQRYTPMPGVSPNIQLSGNNNDVFTFVAVCSGPESIVTKGRFSIDIGYTDDLDVLPFTDITPSNAGAKLVLSERTSFETQFDFLKAVVQAFGLTVSVNDAEKQVRFFTFKALYDNIAYRDENGKQSRVADWSEKVDRNPQSITGFSVAGYGRKNTISLEENSQDEITDKGSFTVSNDSLDLKKDLFTIPFGSGQDIPVRAPGVTSSYAQIPLLKLEKVEVTDEMKEGLTEDEVDNRVNALALAGSSFNEIKSHIISIYPGLPVGVTPVTNLPNPPSYKYGESRHLTVNDMISMNGGYYSELIYKMLKNAKAVEDKFLLTPQDLEEFNPEIPVYIDKYGAYFYVNKIKNYQYGKLTTCELIRL